MTRSDHNTPHARSAHANENRVRAERAHIARTMSQMGNPESLRRLHCISAVALLTVITQLFMWYSLALSFGMGVPPSSLLQPEYIVYILAMAAVTAWIEFAWRHVRSPRTLFGFAAVPCVCFLVFLLVFIVQMTSQPWHTATTRVGVSVAMMFLTLPFVIITLAFAFRVRAPVASVGVRTADDEHRTMPQNEFLAQSQCAECGYQPGPSNQITVCPECACETFVVLDTDTSQAFAPMLGKVLNTRDEDTSSVSPVDVGMSHDEFLARCECEQCGYAPGPSREIELCPECGCADFVVKLDTDDVTAGARVAQLPFALGRWPKGRFRWYAALWISIGLQIVLSQRWIFELWM